MYKFTQRLLKICQDCISEFHFWQTFPGGGPTGPPPPPIEGDQHPSIPSLNDVYALLQPPTLWTEPVTQKHTDNPGLLQTSEVHTQRAIHDSEVEMMLPPRVVSSPTSQQLVDEKLLVQPTT